MLILFLNSPAPRISGNHNVIPVAIRINTAPMAVRTLVHSSRGAAGDPRDIQTGDLHITTTGIATPTPIPNMAHIIITTEAWGLTHCGL